jgi:hypothetical protein
VDAQRAQLQRDGVDGGVGQHGRMVLHQGGVFDCVPPALERALFLLLLMTISCSAPMPRSAPCIRLCPMPGCRYCVRIGVGMMAIQKPCLRSGEKG